jgi:uncharacterized protein
MGMNKLLFFSTKRPLFWCFLVLALTAFFARSIPELKIDTTTQRLMSADDPDKEIYERYQQVFGSDEILTVVFDDPQLFTSEKLSLIHERLYELQLMPEVYKLESLFNTNNFYNNEEGILETIPLFDQVPQDREVILAGIDIARNNPLFFNTLVSAERNSLALHLYSNSEELSNPEFAENFVKKVKAWVAPIKDQYEDVYLIGAPVLNMVIKETMLRDLVINFPISLVIICALLFFIVGTWNASVIPIVTGCLSLVWTMGTLAMLDIPLQLLFTAIPVILVVIGSTEDTHIISGYLDGIEKHKNRNLAIELMSHRLSSAILLTSLTTAVGFSTIMINEVIMLKEFGLITSISIIYNFFITITIVPIFLKFFGTKEAVKKESGHTGSRLVDKATHFTMTMATRFRKETLIGLTLICLVSIVLANRMVADNDPLNSLKESSDFKINLRKMTRYFTGNDTFFITVKGKDGKAVDFKRFENLHHLARIEELVMNQGDFDATRSLATLISLINRELNNELPDQFYVPSNNALISQYLLFLSIDDKEKYVTTNYAKANIVVWYQLSSSEEKLTAIRTLEKQLKEYFKETELEFVITGRSILVAKAAETIISSQVKSLGLIIGAVFLIIGFLFWDIRLAFLSLVPNTVPILILFGLLGLTGIPLDFVTCNIAAIAIGIAVDDTIHFLSKFNQSMKNHHDQYAALEETLKIEMRPILSTSLALALGLFTLGLSDFVAIIVFGLLTGLVILLALLADLLLMPLFLIVLGIKEANTLFDRLSVRVGERLKFNCMAFQNLCDEEIRRLLLRGKVLELEAHRLVDVSESAFTIILEGEADLKKRSQRSRDISEGRFKDNQLFPMAKLKPAASLPPLSALLMESSTRLKYIEITENFLKELKVIDQELFDKLQANLERIRSQGF